MTLAACLALNLPPPVLHRLQVRAVNAGLLDAGGQPDVMALRNRALTALREEGETVQDAIHALTTDSHDPDLAAFVNACIAAAVAKAPPRWPAHLADRVDLPSGTLLRLRLRAERDRCSATGIPDLATMASCALAIALGQASTVDAAVADFIDRHPEAVMRDLFAALEQARAAGRPN